MEKLPPQNHSPILPFLFIHPQTSPYHGPGPGPSGGDPFAQITVASSSPGKGIQQLGEAAKNTSEIQPKTADQSPASAADKTAAKQGKQESQASDLPKEEYIHVRAHRGQATNSHTLAERVRREKISERMKFLQDLVPGCSKVTGKAVMLDEIINYVQSLQRQVEVWVLRSSL